MTVIQTAILFIFAVLASEPAGDPNSPPALLADGVVLSQAPGTVTRDDLTGGWRFSLEEALADGEVELPAGYEMRLLPSRGLDVVTAYADGENTARLRLTGIVTEYDGINFLFALNAVPVRQRVEAEPEPSAARLVTDPNETSVMPQEIFEQLRVERKTDFTKLHETPDLPPDRMVVNRTGYFKRDRGRFIFEIDGFGLGAPSRVCRLLPNIHRLQIEQQSQTRLGRPRYTVTAIETVSEGQAYLLLQQVKPAWSYGNFTP